MFKLIWLNSLLRLMIIIMSWRMGRTRATELPGEVKVRINWNFTVLSFCSFRFHSNHMKLLKSQKKQNQFKQLFLFIHFNNQVKPSSSLLSSSFSSFIKPVRPSLRITQLKPFFFFRFVFHTFSFSNQNERIIPNPKENPP